MNQSSALSNFTFMSCSLPYSSGEVIAHTFAYVVLFAFALVGNLLVVYVIYSNKNLHNIVNCFILNMSLSDLIIPIVIAPKKVIEITTSDQWLIHGSLGSFLCKFVYYITDITPSVSMLSLVFMTGDRFYAVFYPMKAAMIPKSYRIALVVLTWLIPITFFSPYFKSLEVIEFDGPSYYCKFKWSLQTHIIFVSFACVVFIIIPFAILIVLYSLILCKLRRGMVAGGEQLQQQKTRREKTNFAVIKLALVVILVFALCWGPYNSTVFIISFVWGFETPPDLVCVVRTVRETVVFIAYTNTAINPFVYFLLNKNYREGLRKTMRRVSSRGTKHGAKFNTRDATVSGNRQRTALFMEPLTRSRLDEHDI